MHKIYQLIQTLQLLIDGTPQTLMQFKMQRQTLHRSQPQIQNQSQNQSMPPRHDQTHSKPHGSMSDKKSNKTQMIAVAAEAQVAIRKKKEEEAKKRNPS